MTTAVCFGVAAAGYCYVATPLYKATTSIQLMPQVSSSLLQIGGWTSNQASLIDVPTQMQILRSAKILRLVAQVFPNPPTPSVGQVGASDVVTVSVQMRNPFKAADVANEFAAVYIAQQQKESVQALRTARQVVESNLNSIQQKINTLQAQMATATPSQQVGIQQRINSLTISQSTYNQQINSLELASSLATGGGQVVGAATPPTTPSSPNWVTYISAMALLGIAMASLIVLAKDRSSDRLLTADEIEGRFDGIPLLGSVPRVDNSEKSAAGLVFTDTVIAESYRVIRTSMQFMAMEKESRIFLFTSPEASEGKSTTVANLAVALAESGKTVLLVDCDLRRPSAHRFFGFSPENGVVDIYDKWSNIDAAIKAVPDVPNLKVLTSGSIPPNPSEILTSPEFKDLFGVLRTKADIVLIDSPPVIPVADPSVMANFVDCVVMIARAGLTPKRNLQRALHSLKGVGVKVEGFIFNDVVHTPGYYYGYRRRYYYYKNPYRATGK